MQKMKSHVHVCIAIQIDKGTPRQKQLGAKLDIFQIIPP